MGGARGVRAFARARGLTAANAPARPSARGSAARGLLWALAALPDGAALAFGAGLGRAWVRLGLPRTRSARVNLRIAFPEWSEAERARVLVASFENLGRSLVEFAWIGRRSAESVLARVRFEGLEHLETARAAAPDGGVIALIGHFGSWELLPAALSARGLPITIVHRARDDAGFDDVVSARRTDTGAHYVPRGSAALAVLRALRRGELAALYFDQNARTADGVFVPFFGRLACVRPGPVQVAMSTRAPVVPVFLHRDAADPSRHVVAFRPALALERESTPDDARALAENARRMTHALEREIRAAPEQWVWPHERWKTQPPGEPRPSYARARARH
jgi:KDO2-lipid IV(A) lauroyltransferase